jgi:hypothetical protein
MHASGNACVSSKNNKNNSLATDAAAVASATAAAAAVVVASATAAAAAAVVAVRKSLVRNSVNFKLLYCSKHYFKIAQIELIGVTNPLLLSALVSFGLVWFCSSFRAIRLTRLLGIFKLCFWSSFIFYFLYYSTNE